MSQHSVGRTRMINLPAELGWISKNLPLGPRASGQVFTDPPSLFWQVYPIHRQNSPLLPLFAPLAGRSPVSWHRSSQCATLEAKYLGPPQLKKAQDTKSIASCPFCFLPFRLFVPLFLCILYTERYTL